MLILGFKQLQDPYYQGVAAQVAFFFMLSIVPTLILLTQVLGILHITLDQLATYLDIPVTQETITGIKSVFKTDSQITTNIALFIAAIWASSRLHFTLMRVANYTLTEGRDTGAFFRDRGRSIITMGLTVLAMVLTVVILVYGQVVFRFLADRLLIRRYFDIAWTYLRWPIAGTMYLLIISFNYYVLPHNRGKFKEVLPGGIFCSVGIVLVTMVYSAYTTSAVSNNIIYGSMASVAALMFWFYMVSWVLILGIVCNKVWDDTQDM